MVTFAGCIIPLNPQAFCRLHYYIADSEPH